MKKLEKRIFWENYIWLKPAYETFRLRIKAWATMQEAIKISYKSKNLFKTDITSVWRICTKCNKKLTWEHFRFIVRHNNKVRNSICEDCRIEARRKYSQKIEFKESRKKEEKIRRETCWKVYYELDKIYYSDKIIINNRKICQKKESLKEIKLNKFFYFKNKWYDASFLMDIYWLKQWDTSLNKWYNNDW